MLQSSGALSVYTKSICLFGEFGLPGASIDDFYNRFYLIHLNFEINHCTECGRYADYRLPPRGKARFPPLSTQNRAFPHASTCRKARHPFTQPSATAPTTLSLLPEPRTFKSTALQRENTPITAGTTQNRDFL